jgi:hypothetical protein
MKQTTLLLLILLFIVSFLAWTDSQFEPCPDKPKCWKRKEIR